MVITPATELDAVNEIIGIIGQAPVNSLEDDADVDSLNAQSLLRRVSRELQSKGWAWNTETVTLSPDSRSKKIPYRDEWLRLDECTLVRREGYAYDISTGTNLFTATVSASIVKLIGFEDLPEVARRYVTLRAGRIFQARTLGAPELSQATARDEIEAWQAVMEYELDFGAYNQVEGDPYLTDVMSR